MLQKRLQRLSPQQKSRSRRARASEEETGAEVAEAEGEGGEEEEVAGLVRGKTTVKCSLMSVPPHQILFT